MACLRERAAVGPWQEQRASRCVLLLLPAHRFSARLGGSVGCRQAAGCLLRCQHLRFCLFPFAQGLRCWRWQHSQVQL